MKREWIPAVGSIVVLVMVAATLLLNLYEDSGPKRVSYNSKGELVSVIWEDENGYLIGGYIRTANGWLVWSTEANGLVLVPEGRWSPPETDEPVTLEKFPPSP